MIDEQSAATAAAAPDTAAVAAVPASFGAVLAAERERQGISIGDMAGRLRLHPKQLVAIEAEDFAALPTAPFLRGFVRNYAKELRIDATPLLAELSERMAPRPSATPAPGNGSGPRGPGGDRLPRALVITAAVGALIVFGVIGVMSSRDASQAPQTRAPSAAAPASGAAAVPGAPGASSAVPASASSSAPSSATPSTSAGADNGAAQTPPTNVEAPSTPADTASAAPGSTPGATPGPPSAATGSAASKSGTESRSAASAAGAGAAATPPASAASGTAPASGAAAPSVAAPSAPASKAGTVVRSVRLAFNDAAWVRIEDAEGKVLLSQINEAGTEQRVAGRSPLRLIIGNASSVTLDVSGREVDLKSRTSPDNVARVTVE